VQEAYCSVLRAFKVQSGALTWVGNAELVPVRSDAYILKKLYIVSQS
jgi:hypothetical protein